MGPGGSERETAVFTDPDLSWAQLERFMDACRELSDFSPLGIDSDSKYGLCKACADALTGVLAKEYPHLIVNACTPGYIDTDLGREILQGRTPEEAAPGCR